MNAKLFMILRILLGIFVLVFGLNKFLDFIPMEQPGEAAGNYFTALTATKTMMLVGIIEIVAGLALIFNKYGALFAFILMSISVNAVLFHATLEPATIAGSLVLLILNIAVLYGYKGKFKDLLAG